MPSVTIASNEDGACAVVIVDDPQKFEETCHRMYTAAKAAVPEIRSIGMGPAAPYGVRTFTPANWDPVDLAEGEWLDLTDEQPHQITSLPEADNYERMFWCELLIREGSALIRMNRKHDASPVLAHWSFYPLP